MNSDSLSQTSQERLKQFFQLSLDQGCPKDQLLNFSNAGVILQHRQLAASAAARLCDQPDGSKEIGYGGARGGGKTHWLLAQMAVDDCQRVPGLKCLLLRKVGKWNLENMEDLRQRVLAGVPHDFNASRGLLTFPNGSRIVLGHYQCEKDIDNYLGLEYDIIGDKFKEADAVESFSALDYGYTHLTVALLGRRDHHDNLYVLDEHAEHFWIPERHAQAIKAMLGRHHLYASDDHAREAILARYPNPCVGSQQLWSWREKRMLARFVAGADMFSSESNGASVAKQYRDLGLRLRPADMDRVSGSSSVSHRFGDPAAGIPATLFIHQRCKRLLETLPYLQHDPDRPGDILKSNINEDGAGGDDAADALRYLVATKPRVLTMMRLRGL